MPKELRENIRQVVSSWFCFVRAGFSWHWTFFPLLMVAPFKEVSAFSFINSSLYFMCVQPETTASTGNGSDRNQWRMQPTVLLSFTVWQLWLDFHDHLFSISSSLFLSTLLLILRMRWWSHPRKTGISPGAGENGDMFHWPAHSPPHWVGQKEYGEGETTLGWNTVPLDYIRFKIFSYKAFHMCAVLIATKDDYVTVMGAANIRLTTDETQFGALRE